MNQTLTLKGNQGRDVAHFEPHEPHTFKLSHKVSHKVSHNTVCSLTRYESSCTDQLWVDCTIKDKNLTSFNLFAVAIEEVTWSHKTIDTDQWNVLYVLV